MSNPEGPQFDLEQIARRTKAARFLAGYSSTTKLAEELAKRGNAHGLSKSNLDNMEQGIRENVPLRDLDAIADACGLPPAWFFVNIAEAVRAMQPEVRRLPPLLGETGHRLQADKPSPRDQPQRKNPPGDDSQSGTGE